MANKIVCLVTIGHLASDPRLVKEASALLEAGFTVHVIFTQYMLSQQLHDRTILQQNPELKYRVLDWTGLSMRSKARRAFSKLLQFGSLKPEVRVNRNYRWTLNAAASIRADLYIGHNLGALPVIVEAARRNNARCIFDAEDFHRYETSGDDTDPQVALKKKIECHYLPKTDLITVSSREIGMAYARLFPQVQLTPILNVFPVEPSVPEPELRTVGKIRLFWFSQTIGLNRGLNDILGALRLCPRSFELHLLGAVSPENRRALTGNADIPVVFHDSLPPDELITFAARFDIGLALEPAFSPNNDLALSNKIFSYLQAGLTVIASDTIAQKNFILSYPNAGTLYPKGDLQILAGILQKFDADRALLWAHRVRALSLARTTLNWENESTLLLKAVQNVFN